MLPELRTISTGTISTQHSLIVGGEFSVCCEGDAEFQSASFGDRIDAPRGVVHRERHDGYRAVFGWPIDPTSLVMPLERVPPVT
jgi:hypothetical protein